MESCVNERECGEKLVSSIVPVSALLAKIKSHLYSNKRHADVVLNASLTDGKNKFTWLKISQERIDTF